MLSAFPSNRLIKHENIIKSNMREEHLSQSGRTVARASTLTLSYS